MKTINLGDLEGLDLHKGKTLLLDADTIAYSVCAAQEYNVPVLDPEYYEEEVGDDTYRELLDDPNYDSENECVWYIDEMEVKDSIDEYILNLMVETETTAVEPYLTTGKSSFRYTIYPQYKANRTNTRYPAGLDFAKRYIVDEWGGVLCEDYEADDAVVTLKLRNPDKYVLCSVDKDVLNAVAGTHYNYYSSERFSIDRSWVTIEERDAVAWPYIQALMGDSTDNIKGVKGIGKVKATKLMSKVSTEEEMIDTVYKAFGNDEEALMHIRLVKMNQLDENMQVKLWERK